MLRTLLAVALVLGVGAPVAVAEDTRPILAKVHADWCGTCVRLNTTWEALQEQVGDRARLVILDVTNQDKVAKAKATAERLGIEPFFESYKSKTGVIAVIDGASLETVTVLKGEDDPARYVEVLDELES